MKDGQEEEESEKVKELREANEALVKALEEACSQYQPSPPDRWLKALAAANRVNIY